VKRDTLLYVNDILESIDAINEYVLDMDEEDFYKNRAIQDAVIRRLEIIGEAVKNIPQNTLKNHPNIPWTKIAGLRDVLIHSYFGVGQNRVWKVISDNLPELKEETEKIKSELDSLKNKKVK